jgi:plasmid stability protein
MANDRRIAIRLPDELLAGLEATARAHGRSSVSDEARAALRWWVEAAAEQLPEGQAGKTRDATTP